MQIDVSPMPSATMLKPHGDVDMSCARDLQGALHQALRAKPERLIVNLEDVSYMDSSGVATLVEAMQIARKSKTSVVLCNLQDRVRSIFEIARLDRVFKIAATADEALAN